LTEEKAKLTVQLEADTTSPKEKDIIGKKITILSFVKELLESSE
jgi:hypothetical protein